MCGIAGLWAPHIDPIERASLVSGMLDRLRHRGPDGSAVWQDREVTLGLMRLAIVAPHTSASVAGNETGHVRAVLNGEIYNHALLRGELLARGHDVPDGADTLTVPHLYEESGAAFPERIDGQFAVAVWDSRERRLVLARDRAGEKPLFVLESPRAFAFASEPGALACLPWYRFEPSPDALTRYLVHGFIAGEDCAFAGIRQLPPAHLLDISERGFRRVRYWRPWDLLAAPASAGRAGEPGYGAIPNTGRHRVESPADVPAATREAVAAAVASRLPADVPFGVFLSGGVDSGLVATLAAQNATRRFPTFSLRFGERGYDESTLARTVANAIRSEHHEITMDARGGEEALEHVADALHQPLGDPSTLPTWVLAREASRHVPVVLTGEGGDELFGGYPTYLGHRWASRAASLPAPLRDLIVSIARRVRPAHHHLTIPYFIERFMESAAMPPFERHVAWFGTGSPAEALAFLSPDLRAAVTPDAGRAHLRRVRADLEGVPLGDLDRDPALVAYQILDFELYLGGGLLTKVDRCTMDHGMEARAPFLQPDLIHFALALRERDRLRGRVGKWALKQAARDLLPAEILARRKQGFSPPFSAWLRGPLRDTVRDRLSRERIARAGIIDPDAADALVTAHLEGRVERSRTVWTLLSLQMWAERWAVAQRAPVVETTEAREAQVQVTGA
jgi:asparagine synthase (glutamine-hydrolysing)